jgi:hypothetical protein
MNKMRKIRNLVTLLILCCCYTMSFSQTFESKLGGLVEGNIGDPLLVTTDGITIFGACDYSNGEIYLSAYNENHNPLYIRKKLNFRNVKNTNFGLNYSLASQNSSGLSRNKKNQVLGDLFQIGKSVFFKVRGKKQFFIIEFDYVNGLVKSETEKDYNEGVYNEARSKFAKIIFSDLNKDKVVKLLIYNSFGDLEDQCVLPDYYLNNFFNLFFDNDQIFVYNYSPTTLEVFKYDLTTKKLLSKDINLQIGNGSAQYKHEFCVDNSVNNSLVAYWTIYEKGKDRVMFSNIEKNDLNFSAPKDIDFNLMNQYLKSSKIKINTPRIVEVTTNNLGNSFSMLLKYDYDLCDRSSAFLVSYRNSKGEEIYGSAYKFNVRCEDWVSFLDNVKLFNSAKKHFIFLNNIPENFNLKLEDKEKKINTLIGQKPIALEFDESGKMEQYFVFGTIENQNESSYVEFSMSHYDKKTNTLVATMYIDSYMGNSKPVWIKLK